MTAVGIRLLELSLVFVFFLRSLTGASETLPGKWELRAPMPSARTEVAAAELGGKIYVMGGYEKNGGVGDKGKNTSANDEYDPAQDRWGRRAPIPTSRDHHAIGVVNGKLYAIGGRINGRHDRSITENEEYDPATDRWRPRTAMPTVR